MKIATQEIQKNDYASIYFCGVMNYSVKKIREDIDNYKDLKKVNTSIFGPIHALSLLIEHSTVFDNPIILTEAEEWREILMKYFDRIQKKVSTELRESFRQNLVKDLDKIVSKGKNRPEHIWKNQYFEREIIITVENKELKSKYLKLAEENEKYKNKLGNALHNYLDDCLKDLAGDKEETTNNSTTLKSPISFNPTYFKSKPSEFTYMLNDFEFFLDENEQENYVEISAYDIEKAIKAFFKNQRTKTFKNLTFDCESSLFSVQTDDFENLIKLNNALLNIATDNVLKKEYLKLRN